MGAKQEAVVREFCDAWGDGETQHPDVEKVLSLMSQDAVWQLFAPTGPVIRGQAALRAEIERQLHFTGYMQCGLLEVASSDRLVFTERLDHFTMNGKRVAHALIAVYEIDDDGLISAWREYFDTADIAAQLGLTPDEIVGPPA